MSCVPDREAFRLLDAFVGWDVDVIEQLTGQDDPGGITLSPLQVGLHEDIISRALPPAYLARGCNPCEWFLVTCCPPESRILRHNPCFDGWQNVWSERCDPRLPLCGTAIAVHCDLIALSDPESGSVWVWREEGRALHLRIPVARPGPLAAAPHGGWLVADNGQGLLRWFDPSGAEMSDRAMALPGEVDRIGVDAKCRIWLVTRDASGLALWSAEHGAGGFSPDHIEALLAAFPETGLVSASGGRFCFRERTPEGDRVRCYNCHGRPAPRPPAAGPAKRFEELGQLLTMAIDSGTPRNRWHRVRIDADLPPGTRLTLAVSSQESSTPPNQGQPGTDEWQPFQPGIPHPGDWHEGPSGALDFLIDQPPGRYLFVRLRLVGDGTKTPVVRRVRLDFPRQTSLDRLPAVYRDNPLAEDFTERFLSIFDAALEDIDRAIERHPALLDVESAPQETLPWLGSFLDVAMDPAWTEMQRRTILKAAPELYRKRGTRGGLDQTLSLLLGHRAGIEEVALTRLWGAVGVTRIGASRLFGQANARMRLGSSSLSRAPLKSFGNPDLDAVNDTAFRFTVTLPAALSRDQRRQAHKIIDSQKPAHTVARIAEGGAGFVVGLPAQVGIHTALIPLPAPVLGGTDDDPGVRLNRSSILWSRYRCNHNPIEVGETSVVGINTLME